MSRSRSVGPLLEAAALLALGGGMGALALGDSYGALMNPSFRWVTLIGGVLIVGMGVASLGTRSAPANRSALVVFALLFGVVIVGRPLAGGGDSILPPDAELPPGAAREGYDEIQLATLFDEDRWPADGTDCFVIGRVIRLPELEARGEAIALAPQMFCCIADALAFGVRIVLPPDAPDTSENGWYYTFGTLRRLEVPVEPPFVQLGAIRLTVISDRFVLEDAVILDFRTQLPSLLDRVPRKECSRFLAALEQTGLAERLRDEGPFTVFAPHDLGFARSAPADHDDLLRYLETFVVPGNVLEADLRTNPSLKTLAGSTLTFNRTGAKTRVEGARILFGDALCRNGIVHIVHPAWPPRDR